MTYPPFASFEHPDRKIQWQDLRERLSHPVEFQRVGKVVGITGSLVKVWMTDCAIGELCKLETPNRPVLYAEVVSIQSPYTLLVPLGEARGLSPLTRVVYSGGQHQIRVGNFLLGGLFNGFGEPMDTACRLTNPHNIMWRPVFQPAPEPMTRPPISSPLGLGVKAIDTMMTMGEGQRMGIFSAAGGGKSTLLSMIINNTQADVVVVALVGERGREVREFLELHMDATTRQRSVLVVATSDRPAMERARAAVVATTIAEYFRDQGKRVLLMVDSLTRYARALREIGLAAGEPPTRRGFPPSVFEQLPTLLERSGLTNKGSISALYTVLVEGDDMTEPVADETRSLLDGHIVLSRDLASASHYPAIDVLQSVSRVMGQVTDAAHQKVANQVRTWLSRHKNNEILIRMGEYQPGNDRELDIAMEALPQINALLLQTVDEHCTIEASIEQLIQLGECNEH